MKKLKCPNKNIKNPVSAKIILGSYKGVTGWAEKEPNETNVRVFCSSTGVFPYHYNAPADIVKDL